MILKKNLKIHKFNTNTTCYACHSFAMKNKFRGSFFNIFQYKAYFDVMRLGVYQTFIFLLHHLCFISYSRVRSMLHCFIQQQTKTIQRNGEAEKQGSSSEKTSKSERTKLKKSTDKFSVLESCSVCSCDVIMHQWVSYGTIFLSFPKLCLLL